MITKCILCGKRGVEFDEIGTCIKCQIAQIEDEEFEYYISDEFFDQEDDEDYDFCKKNNLEEEK